MARGKAAERVIPEPETEFDEVQEPEISPEDLDVMDLEAELSPLEGVVTVKIYRQGEGGPRDLTYIKEVPKSAFSLQLLQKPPFNGGTFRIHARGSSGLKMNREVRVESITVVEPERVEVVSRSDVAAMVVEGIRAAMPAPVDTMGQLTQLATLMKTLLPAPPAVATTPAAPGITEQIATLTALLSLSRQLAPPSSGVKDEDGKVDVMGTLLTKGIDAIGDMVSMARQGPPQGAALPAPPAQQPTTEQNDMGIMDKARQFAADAEARLALKIACRAAASGETAEDFANENYELVPDDVLAQMETNAAWFTEICAVHPDCAQHEAWFSQVRDFFIQFLKEDAAGLDESAAAGDTAPVSTNGDSAATNGDTATPGGLAPAP